MRILIAPDKFKGTLSASQAAGAMAQGVKLAASRRGIAVQVECCPVADGGEGTLDVLRSALGGTVRTVAVDHPVPGRARVRVPLLCARGTVFIESALACGLPLVRAQSRNPGRISTLGLGQTLAHILNQHPAHTVCITLGGTATSDGGMGLARALGWRFVSENGAAITLADDMERLARIEPPPPSERRNVNAQVLALCDVWNPLTGPKGAARLFAPQKGATRAQVQRLERGMQRLALCAARMLAAVGRDPREADPALLGSGAAGGLGYGLRVFAGARLQQGAPTVLKLIGFESRVRDCALVMTGEGRFDAQTLTGKACLHVARRARAAGADVALVCGVTGGDEAALQRGMADAGAALAVLGACDPGPDGGVAPPQGAGAAAPEALARLEAASAAAFGRWLDGR